MSTLTGTRPMLGLTLRRERLHGSAWYVLSGLLLVVIAAGIVSTYPTAADRETLAASVNASAGELFIIGPVSSTDVGGIGLRGDRAESLTTRTIYGLTTEPDLQEDLWSEAG